MKGVDIAPRTLLLALLLAIALFYGNLAKESYTDDFRAFYVASMATHDHLDPYVNHVDLDEKYADALWVRKDSRFIYPPSALLFFAPLRLISYKWSKTAFGVAMTLSMVGVLLLLYRRYPSQMFVLPALFISLPMFMCIDNGQIDPLILLLALAAFYLEDGVAAGACLGIAIAIKFSPGLLLLWFVADRRWRTVAWSVAVSGGLELAALARWGSGYFREFLHDVLHHADAMPPVLEHVFSRLKMVGNEVLVSPEGVFAYQHDIGGYRQNPLRYLGHAGGALGIGLALGFLVWMRASRRGRGLRPEQSFFLFLVVALLANPLLWAMGLVACFPLIVLLVDSSDTPNLSSMILVVPFLLTKQVVGEQNFLLWLVCAGYCLWRSGWLRQPGLALVAAEDQ